MSVRLRWLAAARHRRLFALERLPLPHAHAATMRHEQPSDAIKLSPTRLPPVDAIFFFFFFFFFLFVQFIIFARVW